MSEVHSKITRYTKKLKKKCNPPSKKKKFIENNSEMIQILELADNDFKLAIITVLKDIKEI